MIQENEIEKLKLKAEENEGVDGADEVKHQA